MSREQEIFKRGSTTYYWSSKFFPEATREDVFKLYSFVRIADDYVDAIPQNEKLFTQLEKAWNTIAKKGNPPPKKMNTDARLAVKNMYDVYKKYTFEPEWVAAFLSAMRSDLTHTPYTSKKQTLTYMYGSAEVIGLMMSKIIGVDPQGYEAAQLQGRAMQYINFIRDISEDNQFGRQYFSNYELSKYGLSSLSQAEARRRPAAFKEFIEAQLKQYKLWQKEASAGFAYVPRSQRIALRTAVDMYDWTAQTIAKDPFIVFDKKVKPSKFRVVVRALVRTIHA